MHPQAAALPEAFIDAYSLPPRAHIDMQAALQPYVDNAISKTVNIPQDYDFAAFREVYQYAYEKGLKGCTTFRPNPVTGEILSASGQGFDKGSHCCDLEREAD
jgi:ribonucleoside-diphosphate reductase alpha chain